MSNEGAEPGARGKDDGTKAVLLAMLSGFVIGFAWFFGTFIPPCVAGVDVWDGINRALNVSLGYVVVYFPFMVAYGSPFGIAAAAIVGTAVYFRKWPAGWPFGLMVFVVSIAMAVCVGVAGSHFGTCRLDFT